VIPGAGAVIFDPYVRTPDVQFVCPQCGARYPQAGACSRCRVVHGRQVTTHREVVRAVSQDWVR
jgi:predicted RNA-binding Zn-ribbon protein involved in translation (DUF1610 family)